MKVTGFKTTVASVEYEPDRFGNHIILQLNTDDGEVGLGYVTPLVGWTLKPLRLAIETLAEQVIGQDPAAAESINKRFVGRVSRPQFDGLMRSAAGLIDIALWDLKAKAAGMPLFRLLGGSDNRVPCYAGWKLWWQYDLETVARHAKQHADAGFKAMKFRLGANNSIEDSIKRTRTLRETIGPDINLHVDLNWSGTVNKVIAMGREMEKYNLFWLEDPIPPTDYAGLHEIAEALQMPVCSGETYWDATQFRAALEKRAFDIAMIDLEIGGITQWIKAYNMVESFGVPAASHMCSEISSHVIAGVGGLIVEYIPWAEPLFKEVPPVIDGKIVLSERPGLGLELDPAGLAKHEVA